MPYDQEAKNLASSYVATIRNKTYCEICGKQPVEWHNPEHELYENRRISHLVSLGFPIQIIDKEIENSQALCRSCHIKADGRMVELQKNHPRRKGQTYTDPKSCTKCGKISKPTWNGMCRSCYDWRRRHPSDQCADELERGGY